MKLSKAIKILLSEGKGKVLQSKSAAALEQTIETLTFWMYEDSSKLVNLVKFLSAKDWEVVDKQEKS